jgi:6-pyruvoyltetrahydropterin/6-carboxytetrahydropterin synthase
MPYRISKKFTFDAAHHLPSLPAGHKCRQVHGHTYTAEFILVAETLVPPGFVTDFADLAPVKHYIDSALDHHDLNEALGFEPTSEALAGHLAGWFGDNLAGAVHGILEAVRISETPSSWAEYRPDGLR